MLSTRIAIVGTALVTSFVIPVSAMAAPASGGGAPSSTAPAAEFAPGRVLVKYKADVDRASQSGLERSHGAARVSDIAQLGVKVLKVPAGAEARVVEALSRSGKVEYAERDVAGQLSDTLPNDPWWSYQWGPSKTAAPAAWDTTTGSSSVVIAVLDTGLTQSADFSGKVMPGRNVMTGSADVTDTNGHGTTAASVAAGSSNNGAGVAGYCWSCQLLPVKVADAAVVMSDVANGIVWATDNGADVISMSLGSSGSSAALQSAVKYASDRGVLLFAAAGNSGVSQQEFPAAYAEVVGVAGSDANDALYTWSNFGPGVDVAAPGANKAVGNDGRVYTFTGTSSATPAAAGIAGLALSLPGAPTAAAVRQALTSSAVRINGVDHGRVDAAATIRLLSDAAPTTTATAPTSPSPIPSVPATPAPSPTSAATPGTTPSSTPSTVEPSPTAPPATSPAPTAAAAPSEAPAAALRAVASRLKAQNIAQPLLDEPDRSVPRPARRRGRRPAEQRILLRGADGDQGHEDLHLPGVRCHRVHPVGLRQLDLSTRRAPHPGG